MRVTERVAASAPPVKLAPPAVHSADVGLSQVAIEGGCLLCGVSYQIMSATRVSQAVSREHAARSVWKLWKINPQQMGTTLTADLRRQSLPDL
jgi:hypothetical protein